MTKKILKFFGLGLAILILMAIIVNRGWFLGYQNSLQNRFYDYDSASSEIVVVAIDEKSLKPENLGPLTQWPRSNYASAIDILNQHGAATIGLDVTFPDASTHGTDDDQVLVKTLTDNKNVVLASRYFFDGKQKKFEWPNPTLLGANPLLGWINIKLDDDGFVRSLPIFSESELGVIDAFSLAVSRLYLRAEPSDYHVINDTFDYSKKIQIPVSTQKDKASGEAVNLMHINYFAQPNQFTRISFSDLLKGDLTDGKGQMINLKDKIVLIGPTALDLKDDYLSPVSEGVRMPGVEIHANNVQTIITQKFLRDESGAILWLSILLFLIANIIIFSFLKVRYALPLVLMEVIGMVVAGIVSYEIRLLLNVVYPILTILLSFVGTYLLRFIMEQKQRKFIESAFGHYVNKTVVKQIEKDPTLLKLGGDKRKITVFFSDIAGFTSVSEKLEPEKLVKFLNEYLGEMTEIILNHNGTLDKYEGDAIMAFWNAPLADAHHELSACQAALENQQRLAELRKKWAKNDMPELHVRIGLHSGEAVVGNMGSEDRFDYTAMGDNVNLASRLEGINKQYGTYIILSESTYAAVKEEMVCRELDLIRVKGRQEPVRIYELVERNNAIKKQPENKLSAFAEGLKLYRQQKFEEAKKIFESLSDDVPSQVFVKRCDEFLKNPPAQNWDGVWNFEVK